MAALSPADETRPIDPVRLSGRPVLLADRLTAATSPLAAFAGLSVGLLVLKMTRQQASARIRETRPAALVLAARPVSDGKFPGSAADVPVSRNASRSRDLAGYIDGSGPEPDSGLLRDASAIYRDAAARGEQLSQRMLARQLRGHGHRFPNEHLRQIAESIGLASARAA